MNNTINKIKSIDYLKEVQEIGYTKTDKLAVIEVSGTENFKFLQSQITYDINKITSNNWNWAAQTNHQGKTIATFRIYVQKEKIYIITSKEVMQEQIETLEKYSVFHKVDFKKYTCHIYEVFGDAKNNWMESKELELNNCLVLKDRKLNTIISKKSINNIFDKKQEHEGISSFLHIVSGWPVISNIHIEKHLPQALNMDLIAGIDYQKGCYIGQENIAKTKYRNINKKNLYIFHSQADSDIKIGNEIKAKIENSSKKIGEIVNIFTNDHISIILGIINTNYENNKQIFTMANKKENNIKLEKIVYKITN